MARSTTPRDTQRYHFMKGRRIAHKGITIDPDRRESEHKAKYSGGRLKKIGPKVTRKSALRWERDGGRPL